MPTRRTLLIFGGVALWVGGIRTVSTFTERLSPFEFTPLDQPEGFRALAAEGGSSPSRGAFDFTIGLKLGEAAPRPTGGAEDVTEGLFSQSDGKGTPVAYFFDYYCPYCRILSGHLSELVSEEEIALTRHHWPIFGATSELAARAALAAGMQGAFAAIHDRFIRTPVRVTPAYLSQVADDLGLTWPRMQADMQSETVDEELDRSRMLADIFGFYGTPALVVGRTVVQGEIAPDRLHALARLERREA